MPEDVIKKLGITLKMHRNQQNLTQDDLSELTGVSKRHIANIEKGAANASFEIVAILSKQLNISLDKIIFAYNLQDDEAKLRDLVIKLSKCTEAQKQLVTKTANALVEEIIAINQSKNNENE